MLCPKCDREMDEVRKVDVIIDSCPKCGGVWLDKGELEKIRGMADQERQERSSYKNDYDNHNSHDDRQQYKKKERGEGIAGIFDIFG